MESEAAEQRTATIIAGMKVPMGTTISIAGIFMESPRILPQAEHLPIRSVDEAGLQLPGSREKVGNENTV